MPHARTQSVVAPPSFGAAAIGAAATLHRSHSAWTGPPAPASGRPDSGVLGVGACLRGLCDELARRFDRPNSPSLSCTVVPTIILPTGTVVSLRRITGLLVSDAYVHGFAPPEGGRIAVSFLGLESTFELTIEDSGLVTPSSVPRRADGLAIAALLVRHLRGWIETPRVVAGSRTIITLPRRRAATQGRDAGPRRRNEAPG